MIFSTGVTSCLGDGTGPTHLPSANCSIQCHNAQISDPSQIFNTSQVMKQKLRGNFSCSQTEIKSQRLFSTPSFPPLTPRTLHCLTKCDHVTTTQSSIRREYNMLKTRSSCGHFIADVSILQTGL